MEDLTFLQYLTILLLGLLFFREELMPWIKQKLGIKSDGNRATQGQVNELAEYVNHRQTEILDKLTNNVMEIREDVKAINRKHEEWERFGVPTRPQK